MQVSNYFAPQVLVNLSQEKSPCRRVEKVVDKDSHLCYSATRWIFQLETKDL